MIREAVPADAAAIAALSIEVWVSTYVKRGVSRAFAEYALNEFSMTRVAGMLAEPLNTVLVSERDEGLDAYIRVTRGAVGPVDGCGETEIATLYVQPRHQASGVGRALVDAATKRFDARLWLKVNEENPRAIGFYQAMGFQKVATVDFRLGDAAYPNDVMVWGLTPSGSQTL